MGSSLYVLFWLSPGRERSLSPRTPSLTRRPIWRTGMSGSTTRLPPVSGGQDKGFKDGPLPPGGVGVSWGHSRGAVPRCCHSRLHGPSGFQPPDHFSSFRMENSSPGTVLLLKCGRPWPWLGWILACMLGIAFASGQRPQLLNVASRIPSLRPLVGGRVLPTWCTFGHLATLCARSRGC